MSVLSTGQELEEEEEEGGRGESTGDCEEAGKEIVEHILMPFTVMIEAGLL